VCQLAHHITGTVHHKHRFGVMVMTTALTDLMKQTAARLTLQQQLHQEQPVSNY